jgi:hypothetical protein
VPALPPYLTRKPIFEQFCALLPERKTNHPLGCHKPRIPERVVFEKLVGAGQSEGGTPLGSPSYQERFLETEQNR